METLSLRNIMLFVGFIIVLIFAGIWTYRLFEDRGSNRTQTSKIHQTLNDARPDYAQKIDESNYANYQQ